MSVMDEPATTEADRVWNWRLSTLLEAGYSLDQAEVIAASSVDLHEAVELVTKGCPHATAAKILL